MSIKATNWAWEQDLRPTEKLVLMAICDCHNASTGKCDPTFEFIAKKAGVSRITAIRIVQKLTDEQYLSTLKSKSFEGKQLPNCYLLHIDTTEYQDDTRKVESRVSSEPKPSIIYSKTEYHSCDTLIKNRKEEPERKKPEKPQASSPDGAFEQFYSAYPNKVGKSQAKKVFSKLSPADQAIVTATLPAFKAWVSKQFKGYVPPHPATYLNQRRFDDFHQTEIDWSKRVRVGVSLQKWDFKQWGPAPGMAGCIVPGEFISGIDGRNWAEWKTAA